MNKVIVNQFGENYLVPAEHAAKFNRRSELVLLAIDLEKAIKSVCDKHDWKISNDGEVKYCTKCNEREWA